MSRELIQTEQELLDFIDLPEVEPGSLKFIFNEQKNELIWNVFLLMVKVCSVKISSSFRSTKISAMA